MKKLWRGIRRFVGSKRGRGLRKEVLESKKILDCEFTKPYETRLALIWEQAGIGYTHEITEEAVGELARTPNIGTMSMKTFLGKFKGYVSWEVVSGYYEPGEWRELASWPNWAVPIHIDPLYVEAEIETLFPGNTFQKWRAFCQEQGIVYMGELTHEKLRAFKEAAGVGIGKYHAVKERVEQYEVEVKVEQWVTKGRALLDVVIEIKPEILALFGQVEIGAIASLCGCEIPKGLCGCLVSTLQQQRIGDLVDAGESDALDSFIKKLSTLPLPEEEFTRYRNNPHNERAVAILVQRFLEGDTLEKIGEKWQVGRERIRQLQNRGVTQVEACAQTCKLREVIGLISGEWAGVTGEQLHMIIGAENHYMRGLLEAGMVEGISFHAGLGLYMPMGPERLEQATQAVEALLPETFKLEDYREPVGQILGELGIPYDEGAMLRWIGHMGYYCYGKIITKQKFTHKNILALLFEEEFREPLYVDEEGAARISELAKNKYNYELESNVRAIDSRIRDVKDILLVDSRTYQHIRYIKPPKALKGQMRDYLEAAKARTQVVNAGELYEHFKGQLRGTKIRNKYGIYALVKYYFEDAYHIGDGNTLNIYLDQNRTPITREEMLLELIKQQGGIMDKKAILSVLKWERFKLEDTLCKSREVIPWGRRQVCLVQNIAPLEVLQSELTALLVEKGEIGHLGSQQLLDYARQRPRLGEIMAANGIDEPGKIAALTKRLVPQLCGHLNLRHTANSPC